MEPIKSGTFNMDKDLLLDHYHCETDLDDLQSVAAFSDKFNIKFAVSIPPKTEAIQNLSGMRTAIRSKDVYIWL